MAERKAEGGKIHPCQKPIALYAWILDNYAKVGDRIFDPYLGSGSSRIAAYKKGFDFYACELDVEYFNAQEERFRRESLGEVKQSDGVIVKQQSLFFLI
jgi:site-specific DNA-methyltransferase (adenine-specific)